MYPRLLKPLETRSFFIFGARGTGKTKLLSEIFKHKKCLWVDLLKEGELLRFARQVGELSARLGQSKSVEWVVIDEVQRAPSLLNEVHSLIEERGIRFALTGSSARKLKRGSANLLAGRALVNELFPLTVRELGPDFSLESVLNWGSLPGVVTETDTETRVRILQSYVDVYLREEIREEQIVRNLDPFARFLEVAAQSSGQIVNYSKIGREAYTDAKSIQRYFQILEDTLLGFWLEPYHASIRKRQRQQAKFFLFDLGVKRALDGALRFKIVPKTYEYGRLFEQFILLEAFRLNSYLHSDYRFSYFKGTNQSEIDLIAERRGSRTWCIEIKSAVEPDPIELRKLVQICADIPRARPAIFCNSVHKREVDGVEVFPWQQGLELMFS